MAKNIHRLLLLFLIIGISFCSLKSQDIHFSQFHNSPANLSPALTGVFDGDYRMIGNYRSQWQSVPVDYSTFSGAYDMKINVPGLKSGRVGAGVVFNADQAGYADFSLLQLALNASYTQQLAEEHFLTLGVQVGTMQQRFQPELLTFDEQWNGDVLDESIPITENFNNTSISLGDFSTGLNWHFQNDQISSNVGVAWMHFLQPNFSFFQDISSVLESKMVVYVMGTHLLTEKIGYAPRFLFEIQDAHVEGIGGLGLIYFMNKGKANEIGLQPSINYRFDNNFTGDALIPMLEIFYQSWKVGISYDVNTSDFVAATNRRGGFEISVQYIIKKVAPPPVFKACPIF